MAFQVRDLAVETVRSLRATTQQLKLRDPDLEDQMRRAANLLERVISMLWRLLNPNPQVKPTTHSTETVRSTQAVRSSTALPASPSTHAGSDSGTPNASPHPSTELPHDCNCDADSSSD
jgi:hypothetical protein